MIPPLSPKAQPVEPDVAGLRGNSKWTVEETLRLLRSWSDSDFATAASGEYSEDVKAWFEGAMSRALDRIEADAARIAELEGALRRCKRTVDRNLHRQNEKIEDVKIIVDCVLGDTL